MIDVNKTNREGMADTCYGHIAVLPWVRDDWGGAIPYRFASGTVLRNKKWDVDVRWMSATTDVLVIETSREVSRREWALVWHGGRNGPRKKYIRKRVRVWREVIGPTLLIVGARKTKVSSVAAGIRLAKRAEALHERMARSLTRRGR